MPVVTYLTAAVRVRVCMWVVLNSHRLLDNKQCASSSSPSFCCFFATLFGEKFFRLRKTGSVKNGAGSMRGGRVLEKLQPKWNMLGGTARNLDSKKERDGSLVFISISRPGRHIECQTVDTWHGTLWGGGGSDFGAGVGEQTSSQKSNLRNIYRL